MNGASREALAAARERLDALTDDTSVDAAELADELAAVTALLDREVSLRRVLTDPAQRRRGQGRAGRHGCCGGQVGGRDRRPGLRHGALPLVRSRATWWTRSRSWRTPPTSSPPQRAGSLDDVEDELFRFGRIVSSYAGPASGADRPHGGARGQGRAAAQPAGRQGQAGHRAAGHASCDPAAGT